MAVGLFVETARGADVLVRDLSSGPVLVVKGEITKGDSSKIVKAAWGVVSKGHNIVVTIDTPGGDVVEAMQIGRILRSLMAEFFIQGCGVFDRAEGKVFEALEGGGNTRITSAKGNAPIPRSDVVRCDSAGALIFYGAVFRQVVGDNVDLRDTSKKGKYQEIPIFGIHRPFFDKKYFGGLTAEEARQEYARLDKVIRDYLHEMGAPNNLIDRMFASDSNSLDLIPAVEFEKYYSKTEPFAEEWLVAKCGNSAPEAILQGDELRDYLIIERAQYERFVREGDLEGLEYIPSQFSRDYGKALLDKVLRQRRKIGSCRNFAIHENQVKVLTELYKPESRNLHASP